MSTKKKLDFINFFSIFFYFYSILFSTSPPLFPAFPPWFPGFLPLFPAFSLWFPQFPPWSPHSHPIPRIPILIPHIPALIPCIPPLIPCVPTLIPCIPIISLILFPDSLFRHLQIANFIQTTSKVYNVNGMIGIELITRVRLGFSHLWEHNYTHNFLDALTPLCSCSIEVEPTSQYFLHCHFFDALLPTLMNDLKNIDSDLPTLRNENLADMLLNGNI